MEAGLKKGLFITFEGSEGSGKSTQIALAASHFKTLKKKVVVLREPGGTAISEKIRAILLDVKNKKMSDRCEMLLYMSARAQLVEEVIKPALSCGSVVLCDRFLDSTFVYKGYGHGMDLSFIAEVGRFVTQDIAPDLTFIMDIDATEGLSRIKRKKDRIELRKMDYHNRVRQGYRALARQDPRRVKIIDVGGRGKEEIHAEIKKHLNRILP